MGGEEFPTAEEVSVMSLICGALHAPQPSEVK